MTSIKQKALKSPGLTGRGSNAKTQFFVYVDDFSINKS